MPILMAVNLIKVGVYTVSNDSFTFNATASGQAQVNQGQTVNATQVNNVGNEVPTLEKVFKKIAAVVPEESQEQIEEEVFGPLKDELDSLTAMPIASVEKPVESSVEKIQALVQPLAPYASKIAAAVGAGIETGLSMVAPPAGWFISATLAAIRALRGN